MGGNGGMGGLADETAKQTDAELKEEELKVLLDTNVNLEDLRPNVGDDATYTKLINAVKEATDKNKDIALLKKRVKALGKAGVDVFNKIKPFLQKLLIVLTRLLNYLDAERAIDIVMHTLAGSAERPVYNIFGEAIDIHASDHGGGNLVNVTEVPALIRSMTESP